MLTRVFVSNPPHPTAPKEGDLYKVVQVHGRCFELAYGYYEACERENPAFEPMPIYPDFIKNPVFTEHGFPFVTKMQDICPHYEGNKEHYSECAECRYYCHGDDLLGICTCPKNRQANKELSG